MKSNSQCWCGSYNLADYSPAYWHCHSCDTLVSKEWQQDASGAVKDEGEFYGKDYFLEHQQQGGHPSLHERVRNDLTDRIPHWISALLKYRVPPARVLELGSAHGGFVAFLNWAGYDATGLDLSPWVTQFARDIFGVPMLQGSLASQFLQPASLDIIAHMDVLDVQYRVIISQEEAILCSGPERFWNSSPRQWMEGARRATGIHCLGGGRLTASKDITRHEYPTSQKRTNHPGDPSGVAGTASLGH